MNPFLARFESLQTQIAAAALAAERDPFTVQLLAVSKTFSPEAIEAIYALGQRAFGENYAKEFEEKVLKLSHLSDIQWHFIGPIQSNKTRIIAEHAHWAHSLDRLKIISRLAQQRPSEWPALNCCIQVNLGDESTKRGCTPEAVWGLAEEISKHSSLKLRGLMCIPEEGASEALLKARFLSLQTLFIHLKAIYPEMDTLSMGMSSDFPLAIQAGATCVRVGSALFGQREKGLHGYHSVQ